MENRNDEKKYSNDERVLQTLEIHGKNLIEFTLHKDPNRGAQMVEVTSGTGMGKTSALLYAVTWYLAHHPEDKIIWNNSHFTPSQFLRLPKGCYDIYIEKGKGLYFKDIEKDREVKFPNTFYFEDFKTLWEQIKPGRVSVVVFLDRTDMVDFIHFIRKKAGWVHVFIDEAADVFPSDTSGKMNKKLKRFSEVAKELRKCRKALWYDTQSTSDLDYRVRRKRSVNIMGPASKVERTGTRVYQQAVDKLKKDPRQFSCFISVGGEFGLICFKKFFAPAPDIQSFYDEEEQVEDDVEET